MRYCSLSVLIPCYNAGIFIQKTIQSILLQNYKIDKIVVINDGSTDTSYDILKDFGDKIVVLHHENGKNKGQASSLNLGLKHIDSEYVALMDADDLWHADKLASQVEILRKNPGAVLCYANGHVIDDSDRYLFPILPNGFEEKNNVGNILLDCYIRTPSMVVVRRSIFDQIGNFCESLAAPDHDMWVRMSEVGKFCFLDRDLVGYRQHAGQLSVNHARKMWEDGFVVLQNAAKRYPYPNTIKRQRKAILYFRIAQCDAHDGKYLYSIYNMIRSITYDPLRAVAVFFDSCTRIIRNLLFSR